VAVWWRMAALQLVGIEELFPRSGGAAASRSSRGAAGGASRQLSPSLRLCPLSGPQAKLACVRTGAPQAAQAASFHPHCAYALYPARKQSLRAFEPARRRRRKPPVLTPITAHSIPSN